MPEENIVNPHTSLYEISKACMDSPGYVIFAAVITDKADEKGARIIDFHYRRYQFGFEDVKTTIDKFKEALVADKVKYDNEWMEEMER
jgi:hypothetical protein